MPTLKYAGSFLLQELRELQRHIQNDEKMLLQFVEEKVQLAWQAQDLINMHQTQLDEVRITMT